MSTLIPPSSKPSKWRLSSNKNSKRPSEAAISEIRFNPISDPNLIPPERMSSLVGYTINPAFSDAFSGSKTNEAMLSTIATTDLTKSQRKPRKPSINDEAALFQAIRHLSEIGSKDEYSITVQELNAWRTAVNIAYMTFTEDGVVPIASLANSAQSVSILSKSKSFSIPRKPVPSTISEMPSKLSKKNTTTTSSRINSQRKFSLPSNGHNPLIDSPKLRSGLPIGQMHALEVDRTNEIASTSDWTKTQIKVENEVFDSLIQSPTPNTSDTITFDMNEWSMVTPKATTTTKQSTTQLSYLFEKEDQKSKLNGFIKEECENDNKLKRIPDVSGTELEKTYTYSDYGDDGNSLSSFDHSNATNSNHSSPRTEEVHLRQLNVHTNQNKTKENLNNSPIDSRKSFHHYQSPSSNCSDKNTNSNSSPCRIRVPLSVKRSIQDQRWAPGSQNRFSMQDDSDEEDDDLYAYSTTKKPIKKTQSQSRKNDMLGMLDFLSSGPPE